MVQGVVAQPPLANGGGRREWPHATPCPLFFLFSFFFCFLKINIFIYFLIIFFIIKMDTWRWHGIWRNLLKFLTEFDCRDQFIIIANHKDLLWTCNYPL
jgi:hypothetical protein